MTKSIINGNELAESTISAIGKHFDYVSRDGRTLVLYKNTLRVDKDLLCVFHQARYSDIIFVVFDETPLKFEVS